MNRNDVSVVVPVLDEAAALERNLPRLVSSAPEVVVSDGGSSDESLEIASELGARVVRGSAGRGPQLNRGAAATTGRALLFLHADTVLPDRALEAIAEALEGGAVGGGFQVRFESDRPIYRLGSRIVNLRTRAARTPLGDQAQFVDRAAFEALRGYRDWPILEDLEFMRRLKRHGKVTIVPEPVATSVRRFEQRGITRTIVLNWLIFLLYFARVPPEKLARFYTSVR